MTLPDYLNSWLKVWSAESECKDEDTLASNTDSCCPCFLAQRRSRRLFNAAQALQNMGV